MKLFDILLLVCLGFAIWVLGTFWYWARGPVLLETTSLRYWANFVLTPIASAALCIAVLKFRHIPGADWASAMLLVALPGMFGEALILSRFSFFMRTLRPETSGRYGALLFACYGVVLTIAEIVTLRSR